MPEGGTELVRTDAGILAGVAPREGFQDAVLAMSLAKKTADGTVPQYRLAHQTQLSCVHSEFVGVPGRRCSSAGSKTVKPGQPALLNLATRFSEIEVTPPRGKSIEINREAQPQLIFTQTDELGFYEARPAKMDRVLQLFTVNLFSEQESNIKAAGEVQIGTQEVAAKSNQTEVVRIEYWRWLLGLSLILLTVEWYLYNRRVAI